MAPQISLEGDGGQSIEQKKQSKLDEDMLRHNKTSVSELHKRDLSSWSTSQSSISNDIESQKSHNHNHYQQQQRTKFPVSRRRWAILFAICTFGFLNGICNEVNSILKVYVELLSMQLDSYIYLSQLFLYVPLIMSFPSAWFLDRFGLKATMYIALVLTIARNLSRSLLFLPQLAGWHKFRLIYWFVQGLFTTLVVTIYYCLPLKVSESWFNERERSLAWTLILVVPTIGSAVAQLVVPHYVTNAQTVTPLAYVNMGALIITFVVIVFGITKSQPRHAPSERNARSTTVLGESMMTKLRRLLTDSNVLIQMVTMATFDSLTASINSLLQDIFSGAGLSQVFCGQYLAMTAIVSFVIQMGSSSMMKEKRKKKKTTTTTMAQKSGQLMAGGGSASSLPTTTTMGNGAAAAIESESSIYARKTRACKIQLIFICLAFQLYAFSLNFHHLPSFGFLLKHQWLVVIIGSLIYTGIRCWSSPRFNDLGAQLISGSISEATISAAATVVTSVLINIYSVIFVRLRQVVVVADAASGIMVQSINQIEDVDPVNLISLANYSIPATLGNSSGLVISDSIGGKRAASRPDYSRSIMFACLMSAAVVVMYLIFFDGQPKRRPPASRPSVGGPSVGAGPCRQRQQSENSTNAITQLDTS